MAAKAPAPECVQDPFACWVDLYLKSNSLPDLKSKELARAGARESVEQHRLSACAVRGAAGVKASQHGGFPLEVVTRELATRLTHNLVVVGSSPTRPTTISPVKRDHPHFAFE